MAITHLLFAIFRMFPYTDAPYSTQTKDLSFPLSVPPVRMNSAGETANNCEGFPTGAKTALERRALITVKSRRHHGGVAYVLHVQKTFALAIGSIKPEPSATVH